MNAGTDILSRIAAYKRKEAAAFAEACPLSHLIENADEASPPRGFRARLESAAVVGRLALIAEIKKASPSRGVIRADFDPQKLARACEKGGAVCLSVLTDAPSFQGALDDLPAARDATSLPVLRKDFMVDPYQIVQSRVLGADCILIILAMVDDEMAEALLRAASDWGMDTLVEVHDESELKRALDIGATLIGINNRDLKTFVTDIETAIRLKPSVPAHCHVVAESGLSNPKDLQRLAAAGITSYLVGESLMREHDVEAATHNLIERACA